jgi:hypothetical protein
MISIVADMCCENGNALFELLLSVRGPLPVVVVQENKILLQSQQATNIFLRFSPIILSDLTLLSGHHCPCQPGKQVNDNFGFAVLTCLSIQFVLDNV